MSPKELLEREERLLGYALYKYPDEHKLKPGLEYEKNLWNGTSSLSLNPTLIIDEYQIDTSKNITPILWGKFIIKEDTNLEELKTKLHNYEVRVKNKLTTDYLRELGWKYPLHFQAKNKKKIVNLVVMPPKNDDVSRTIYINGVEKHKLDIKHYPSLMFGHDWHYLLLTPEEIKRGSNALKPKKDNTIYKYLKGIIINKTFGKLQLIPNNMTTKELRDLLKETPLNFEFEGMDLLVLPKKKDGYDVHKVYVNGIEQFSIGWFEPLHQKWFCRDKNPTQIRESFEKDWRCLLSLNNDGREPQNWLNLTPKYYKGIITNVEHHIQEQLKKPNPEKIFHVRDIIRNLLAERATFNKFKNYGKHP